MSIKDVKLKNGMRREEVNELIGEWITLEDDVYMGNKHKHNWKCKCGNIIEGRMWSKIKERNSIMCNKCLKEHFKKKHKNAIDDMRDFVYIDSFLYGDILPNGVSVKKESYIKLYHEYCGKIFVKKTKSIYNYKYLCPHCCGSYENSFAHYIEVELGLKLEDVWDFEKNTVNPHHISKNYSKSKVWIKCNNVEYHNSYEISCSAFINSVNNNSTGCPYCHSKKVHPRDSFAQYHIDNTDPNFLEKYWDYEKNAVNPWNISVSNAKKIWIKCQNEKSHESYTTQADSFKKGHRCGKCHNFGCCIQDSFGYHHFDKVMSWHPDNDISPFRVRRSSNRILKFVCDECGCIFKKSLNKVDTGQWCTRCSKSNGEKKIIDMLHIKGIEFIYDKPYFKDLLSDLGNPLRPDFILPDHKIWIEYDGEFHYKDIYKDGSINQQILHDNRKNEYAKKHNWKMIRIPYWEFQNISDILEREI